MTASRAVACALALAGLSLAAESADVRVSTLETDDGIERLRWVTHDGIERWAAPLGPGVRDEEAARSLLAAGRTEQARELLARALELGAGESALRLWEESGGGAVPRLMTEPGRLFAGRWYPELPAVGFDLLGGGEFTVTQARGEVLILDFWATWCEPCAKELPRLRDLLEAEKSNGLRALAVNVDEDAEVALPFADSLDLRMPIARYDPQEHAAFKIKTLPTVIIADRRGRVRFRWDDYSEGLEEEIAAAARKLLEDEEAREPIATVLSGDATLEVVWMRRMPVPIEGLAVLSNDEGAIVVHAGQTLRVLRSDGWIVKRVEGLSGMGRLRLGDLDGDGRPEVLSFRLGSTRLHTFNTRDWSFRRWQVTSPVLDLAVLPARDAEHPGQILLATSDGLLRADGAGTETEPVDGSGPAGGLAVDSRSRALVLEWGRSVTRLDTAGRPLERVAAGDARSLVVHAGVEGWGLAPATVVHSATGDLLSGAGPQAAIATADGQLLVIDLETGRPRFRARWPGIGRLAIADLDGDGSEELLVAAGPRLVLLRERDREE